MDSLELQSSRLFHYFCIIGLKADEGLSVLEEINAQNSEEERPLLPPLQRSYKPHLLGYYPDHVPHTPFDANSALMLSLPKGLQLRTQKHQLKPHFHPFVITRENGSHYYGFAFTFYEEVNSKKICTSLFSLQASYLTDVSYTKGLPEPEQDPDKTHSLPRQIRLCDGQRETDKQFYDITKDQLFVPKCIVLLGTQPYLMAAGTFLTDLYKVFTDCESTLTLESYVYNLLFEVPAPPIGRCFSFTCVKRDLISQRPSSNELPLFEYSLQEFFSLLSIEVVLQLMTCVLLENQVILVSSEYYRLMLVAESICTLVFPFTWQNVYVPILPASLSHFLDAPVPFIMGLQRSSEFVDNFRIPNEANLCLVDIDNDSIEVPEDTPTIPYKSELQNEVLELLSQWDILVKEPDKTPKHTNEPRPPKRRKHSWTKDPERGHFHSSLNRSPLRNADAQRLIFTSRTSSIPKIKSNKIRGSNYGIINLSQDLQCSMSLTNYSYYPTRKDDPDWVYNELKFNSSIREVFLNLFVQMFCPYESFINVPNLQDTDMEQWLATREAIRNFDKTSFLIDLPESHLPFLSRFTESQLFTSLVDQKILSQDKSPNVRIFDERIRLLKSKHDDSAIRVATYEPCSVIQDTQNLLTRRLMNVDYKVPPPQPIDPDDQSYTMFNPGQFPLLDKTALNKEPSKSRKHGPRAWRRRERQAQHLEQAAFSADQKEKILQEARLLAVPHSKLDISSAYMANTNWKFVEQLLKECNTRTKRMLVQKMGSEAIELGHGEGSLVGVEENTLIASLCELLERIWGHGLQRKHGKSALWSYLLSFQETFIEQSHPIPCHTPNPNFLSPGLSSKAMEMESAPPSPTHSQGKHVPTRSKSVERCQVREPGGNLNPLSTSVAFDMKNVLAMPEINTHIGYARAWVRLSLEKKLLSTHLNELLSNGDLLRTLYKRYAFLRCEEERVQLLTYLLSLNAVDYFCFTNKYHEAIFSYRVIVFTSRKLSAATTTANAWVTLGGSLCHTETIAVPKNQCELVFQHKNLGLLTTLRIGHDNSGISPKWLVEHVLVRNEVTGHIWKFPCGRWLGRGIDDGSLERILVGELVAWSIRCEDLVEMCRTPPRCRSPSVIYPKADLKSNPSQIQQLLGDAVNSIVKFFCKPEKEKGNLTALLCGDLGLVRCLELVFSFGYKSSRLFGKNLYMWDYFEKVTAVFWASLREEYESRDLGRTPSAETGQVVGVKKSFGKLVHVINECSSQLGKDDKFQLFVCLAAREHMLHRMILPLQRCSVTSQMFEDYAFLRDPALFRDLINVLSAISEFEFHLETTLTRGIHI